jgi:putative membrane protein
MTHAKVVTLVVSISLVALLAGCSGDSGSRRTTISQTSETTNVEGRDAVMRPTRALTDANILAILEAANKGEIMEAKLAQQRAMNPEVRLYASRMTQEHQALLDQGSNLASRLNITPALPAGDRELTTEHQVDIESLKSKSGEAFDRAYLDHKIQVHEQVLRRLEDAAMEAQHPEVRTLLAQVQPGIQAHLKAARDLQRGLLNGQR